MAKQITVTIHHGKATIKVDGVQGKACTDITKQLEEALGSVTKRDLTEEYSKAKEVRHDQTVNQ